MGQKPVFHHLAGHGGVAADLLVVKAAGGHGGAKGHPRPRTQGHGHQPHEVEQHRELFVGLFGAVVRLHRDQTAPLLLGAQQLA